MNDPYCQLKVVGEPFAMSGASIAVRKGNPLFIPLSEALQSLKAKGLTDYIQKFWVSKYSCKRETPPAQLKVEDLSGLFLQLTIAMIACILGTLCHRTFLSLYYRERWKFDENDCIEEEDPRSRFAQTETLVWDKILQELLKIIVRDLSMEWIEQVFIEHSKEKPNPLN